MSLFNDLRQELSGYLEPDQVAMVHKAFVFADEAHKKQVRHSGEPYITHPLAVAKILADMRMDYECITAAILHDVIEDTAVNKAQIVAEFGTGVAELVDGVSKLTQIEFASRAEAQAENFRKMVLAMTRDIRVILVKLADRLHNMRTLGAMPAHKRRQKAIETLDIYAPIAHRLGLHKFKVEFEDLGLMSLYPHRFEVLQSEANKIMQQRKDMLASIETAIRDSLERRQLPPAMIYARCRHLHSIYQKMKAKHVSLAEVMDVLAFRIIVDNVDNCYRTLGAVHNLYKPVPERFRDYIAIPKTNGYQALHTTLFGPHGVPIDIQIRTREMDNVADHGIAAYWMSQTSKGASEAQARAQDWLKGLVELQQSTGNSLEFIENVKVDLFPNEIYVFTPKGAIMELPQGATPVDFAYSVHSDVGNSCIAAKIDKRLTPLSTVLVNGQTVEVITAPGARPNPAWLNFVVTSKARSNIKNYLKDLRFSESINLGKRLLQRTLRILGHSLNKIPDAYVQAAVSSLNFHSLDELLAAIGLGNQMATSVAMQLIGKTAPPKSKEKKKKHSLLIKGTEGMVVKFAECCRPIPGDPIIGFFDTGHGIVVHIKQCPQAIELQNEPERYLPVRWEENIDGEFRVDIRIEVANERGVLAQLTSAIADAQANIENVRLEARDGNYSSIDFTLSVRDRTHLARVIRRLRAHKVIAKLTRKGSAS